MTEKFDKLEWLQRAGVVLLFAALFFNLTVPIFDPDFWWHLASGKWMWQHGALITGDPFTIDSPFKEPSLSGSFVLRQYWLSQLIFYGAYAAAGYQGIILLGAAVFTLMFFFVYRLMREAGGNRVLSLLFLYAVVMVVVAEFGYIGTKPQMWSSLFALVIVWLLERLKRDVRWAFWAVPGLMLFWANLHGGFILGDAIIVIYLAGALISRTLTRRLLLVCLAAVLVSGLNPNGFSALVSAPLLGQLLTLMHIPGLEQMKVQTEAISETRSIFQHASMAGIIRQLPFFAGLMGVSLAGFLLNFRRLRLMRPEFLLLFLLVFVMGLRSIRFIVFFATIAPAITVANLRLFREGSGALRLTIPRPVTATLTLLVMGVMGGRFAVNGLATTALGSDRLFASEFEKGADFIVKNRLAGNMFNDYNAGGYLIWRLAPEVKVFIDGRVLYGEVFSIFRSVVDNPFEPVPRFSNRPNYDVALDFFKIDLVFIPGCDRVSGTLIKLAPALLDDPAWALVYDDENVLIFMRDSPRNHSFIQAHARPKSSAYRNIYSIAQSASASGHAAMMPNWKLSMAVAYAGIDNRAEALRWLAEYRSAAPDDKYAAELQRKLATGIAP